MAENRDEIAALARELFARAQRGEELVHFPSMDEASRAKRRAHRAEMLGSLGEIRAMEFLGTKQVMQRDTPETEYTFRLTFEAGRLDNRFGFFPEGKLNRWGLHPIAGELNPLERYMPKRNE